MGMIGGDRGILLNRLAKKLHGQVMTALLMRDHAQPVQTVGMAGVDGQHAAVKLLGFVEPPFPVAFGGAGEQLPQAGAGERRPGLCLMTGAALLAVHGRSGRGERKRPDGASSMPPVSRLQVMVAPMRCLFNSGTKEAAGTAFAMPASPR